ncbi:MAG: rhomboid family intramembrane serine protease [Spirochaetes bacterium]|nr:rhomboid family intramembrane serine protease [Spirochaetota bacterium]
MEGKNRGWIGSLKVTLSCVLCLVVVFAVSRVIPLNELGIRPRTLSGLPGILFSPLLHGDIGHLTANALSFLILGTVFFALVKEHPYIKIMHFVVLGGLGTWLIGRSSSNHIGLSGVIYGIMGYLMSFGLFEKRISAILISVVAFIFYGGALWGVLPGNPLMSWESHLCGFLSGIATAWMYSRKGG